MSNHIFYRDGSFVYSINEDGRNYIEIDIEAPLNHQISSEKLERIAESIRQFAEVTDGMDDNAVTAVLMNLIDYMKMAAEISRLRSSFYSITNMIGNVNHKIGNGSDAARMRGELLNNIRRIANDALKKD